MIGTMQDPYEQPPKFFTQQRTPIEAAPENEALTLNRRRTEALESIAEALSIMSGRVGS